MRSMLERYWVVGQMFGPALAGALVGFHTPERTPAFWSFGALYVLAAMALAATLRGAAAAIELGGVGRDRCCRKRQPAIVLHVLRHRSLRGHRRRLFRSIS
jgi:MFS family permease